MSVRVHYRLTLTDGERWEQSKGIDDAAPFIIAEHGVYHYADSSTGKVAGDYTFFPMHRVEEVTRWRTAGRAS